MKRLCCIATLCSGVASVVAQETKPNILIFIADDLGWEEVGAYGNPVIKTPNIDWLAQQGMRFDNFYLTASSSSPSRSSILSGLYPSSTGARNLHENMPADVTLFPERLQDVGYYTMLVGKQHGTNDPSVRGRFDLAKAAGGLQPWTMVDAWKTALENRPKDQPFFMFAASIDPHRPYKQGVFEDPYDPADVIVPPYLQDSPEMREDLADYYDEIGRFDDHIGAVLNLLREEGSLENTMIVVMTDNGRPFPQSKTRVNVQGLRSPFIVYYPPMVEAGTTTKSLASSVDIAATLLDLAGLEPATGMQGVSLLPVLNDPEARVRKYAFAEHNWHNFMAYERAVMTEDYLLLRNWLHHLPIPPNGEYMVMPAYQKMLESYQRGELPAHQSDCFISPRPEYELFDVNADIHCLNNISQKRKQSETLESMKIALDAWLQSIGDYFPGEENLKPDAADRVTGVKY